MISKRKTKKGCILWKGKLNKRGYSHHIHGLDGKRTSAHRMSYEIANGEFDKNLFICHRCNNPTCVNAEHLYAGTHKDNMRDVRERGKDKNK